MGSAATDGDLFGFSTSNMKGLRQRPAPTAVAAMQPLRSRRPGSTRSYAATASRMTTVPAWWDELTAFTAPATTPGAMTILRETARILTGCKPCDAQAGDDDEAGPRHEAATAAGS